MLKHEREQLGYANLMFLKSYGVKEVVDAVEDIVVYLKDLRVQNWRYPEMPFARTMHLVGHHNVRSLLKIEIDKHWDEKLFLQNTFFNLTAECKETALFPNSWVAEFKDPKAIGGIESIKYLCNVMKNNLYKSDIINIKFINNIFSEIWFSRIGEDRSVGGQDFYRLVDENKEGIGYRASEVFINELGEKLDMPVEHRQKLKGNTPDISALTLMAIDKRVANRTMELEEPEPSRAIV